MAEKWTKTSSPSGRAMKPYPFSLLNHLTVPCDTPVPPHSPGASAAHRRPGPPESENRAEASTAIPCDSTTGRTANTQVRTATETAGLPLRFERPAVVVLEAEHVVLGRVTVGDLEH